MARPLDRPSRSAGRPQLKEIRVPGQRVNRLFTIMKKGLRTDFGPRQSPIFMSRRRLQGTRSFLRFGISKRRDGVRQRPRPYREPNGDDEDALSDNLAAVNDRLDDLTRQIERMTLGNAEIRSSGNERND